MQNILWAVLIIIAFIVVWLIIIYNSLIRLKNRAEEAWSDIDVQLKRRYDLIPNLIETVKGYAKHEASVLENVTKARTAAMNAKSLADKAKAENFLSNTLKSLFAVAESYPDLKATQNYLQLQDELSDTENKIQASRRFYNANVRDLNIKLQVFPNNLMAKSLGFSKREFFEIEEPKERDTVKVKF